MFVLSLGAMFLSDLIPRRGNLRLKSDDCGWESYHFLRMRVCAMRSGKLHNPVFGRSEALPTRVEGLGPVGFRQSLLRLEAEVGVHRARHTDAQNALAGHVDERRETRR